MSDAAPKPWVKALRIKSTPWRVLVGLWGHGSYKADGPAFVWVNRKKLAAEIGLPLGTLKNGLDALAALSWIVREGGGWRLAWMTPGNFTRPADGPARPTGEPARPQADPAHGEATPARPQADPRPADGPHNLYGTSNYPPTNVEVEARDLPPPPRSKPAQTSLVIGKPSASPLVTPSMAEAACRGVTGLDAMTANEKLAVYATPADPWPAKVRAASESAHYHLDASDGPAPSYGGLMTQARANYGDEAVLEVLRVWELDGGHPSRPPANKLWWRSWVPWVETVLDIKPPEVKPQAESPFAFHPSPELTVVGSMT